jgi:hypothetical protein
MLSCFYFNYEPDTGHHLDEDEQLARALQESMNDGPHFRIFIQIIVH